MLSLIKVEKQSVRSEKYIRKIQRKILIRNIPIRKKKKNYKKGGSGSVDEDERATSLTAHNQGSLRSCWSFATDKNYSLWAENMEKSY